MCPVDYSCLQSHNLTHSICIHFHFSIHTHLHIHSRKLTKNFYHSSTRMWSWKLRLKPVMWEFVVKVCMYAWVYYVCIIARCTECECHAMSIWSELMLGLLTLPIWSLWRGIYWTPDQKKGKSQLGPREPRMRCVCVCVCVGLCYCMEQTEISRLPLNGEEMYKTARFMFKCMCYGCW